MCNKKRTTLSSFEYIIDTGGRKQAIRFAKHFVNHSSSRDWLDPLTYAITKGHSYLVKPLLKAGANPDRKDKDRRTLLELSIDVGDEATALLLFDEVTLPDSVDPLYRLWRLAHDNGMEKLEARLTQKLKTLDPPEPEPETNHQAEVSVWKTSCDKNPSHWFFIRTNRKNKPGNKPDHSQSG